MKLLLSIILLLLAYFSNSQELDIVPTQNKIIRRIPTEANQGVAVDKKHYYAISNTKITKHDKVTNELVSSFEADLNNPKFRHFKHMNSGVVVGDKLYIAHSRYKIDPNYNTIEIFNVKDELLKHEKTISMPRKYGSLTWADKRADGSWWICYAVYGESKNKNTILVKYHLKENDFIELKKWYFPDEVVANWGDMSCSGGSWGSDGKLYTTGHDHEKALVLEIGEDGNLALVGEENNVGFYGQAIAWDRFSDQSSLWGIVKRKFIMVAEISNN